MKRSQLIRELVAGGCYLKRHGKGHDIYQESTGKVLIRRKDGRTFALIPEKNISSPLDVPSIEAKVTTKELVDIVREGRER